MSSNFTNGAMVFRLWPDGSGEVIAKFQYRSHAEAFAKSMATSDAEQRDDCTHSYSAVSEAENSLRSFSAKRPPQHSDGEAGR